MTDLPSPGLDEERVKAILARAIEIDSHTSTTSIDELKSIALELGISTTALDTALREQVTPRPSASGNPSAATAVAATGLLLGAAAGVGLSTVPLINFSLINMGLTGLGLLASGAILVLQGSSVNIRSFGARNLVLWGGYAAGGVAAVAILGGAPGMELPWIYPLGGAVQNFVSTSILGSAAVLAMRRVLPRPSSDASGSNPSRFIQRAAAGLIRATRVVRVTWTKTEMRGIRLLRVSNTS